MTLTRRDHGNGHSYWKDGRKIPGVTTLLGDGIAKPGLPYWSAKMVAEYVVDNLEEVSQLRQTVDREEFVRTLKRVPWDKRDQAAVKGTKVHKIGEKLIRGEEVEVPEEYTGYVEGYARFLDKWQVEPLMVEKTVYNSKWGYPGTFDLLGRSDKFERHGLPGDVGFIDLKTSASGIYGETGLQIASYDNCDLYLDDGEEKDFTYKSRPEPAFYAAFWIREDGTDLKPLCVTKEEKQQAFKYFLHAAYMANGVDEIKGYVKPAIYFKEE